MQLTMKIFPSKKKKKNHEKFIQLTVLVALVACGVNSTINSPT